MRQSRRHREPVLTALLGSHASHCAAHAASALRLHATLKGGRPLTLQLAVSTAAPCCSSVQRPGSDAVQHDHQAGTSRHERPLHAAHVWSSVCTSEEMPARAVPSMASRHTAEAATRLR